MDVAKLVALILGSNERFGKGMGSVNNAKGPRLPLVLVPTTAGTGSEVTPVAIITVGEEEKKGVSSSIILPDIAILDPELTLGLPAGTTAATGIDAMVHAIEAYASKSKNNNPISRMIAIEALKLLGQSMGAGMTALGTAMPYVGAAMLAGKALGFFNNGGMVGPLSEINYKQKGGDIDSSATAKFGPLGNMISSKRLF